MDNNIFQEENNEDQDDINSRLNLIIENIQKPKKLVLPKSYLRRPNTQVDLHDIQENLDIENVYCVKKQQEMNILEPSEDVKNEAKKIHNKIQEKKTKNPTAYNIFVKETVQQLTQTRKDLTPKERFRLAITMWNEHKQSKNK